MNPSPQSRRDAERHSLEQLRAGHLSAAVRSMLEFERQQNFPRGLNIDWQAYDGAIELAALEHIATTRLPIHEGTSEDDLAAIRAAAQLSVLWGSQPARWMFKDEFNSNRWDETLKMARAFEVRTSSRHTIASFIASGVVRGSRWHAAPDSCRACKSWDDKVYPLTSESMPPHPDCTHPMGCRCCLTSVLYGE